LVLEAQYLQNQTFEPVPLPDHDVDSGGQAPDCESDATSVLHAGDPATFGRTYRVKFRVRHKANPGEQVVCLGSIGELDNWMKKGQFSHVLKWSAGDIWESTEQLVTKHYFFHYKYAVIKGEYVVAWERGVDRVVDLEILPEARHTQSSFNPTDYFFRMEDDDLVSTKSTGKAESIGNVKTVEISENWERLWVSFMVYHPKLVYAEGDRMLFNC
jgi:hypothetical protein